MNIQEALGQMDTLDDDLWTGDGSPKTDAVSALIGRKVTRAEITDAAPKFSRSNTDLSFLGEEPEDETEVEEAPVDMSADDEIIGAFMDMEPMLPHDLANTVLSKISPERLPAIDQILSQQMASFDKLENDMKEMKRKLKMSRALTQTWIKQLIPDMTNQQAIQEYIRSSAAQRSDKAAKIKEVFGGLKASDIAKLDPRAAIDRAFARKTGRGGGRPTR